jgi:hypothetical protein
MAINSDSTKMTNKLGMKMPANGIKWCKIPGSGNNGEKRKEIYMKWIAMQTLAVLYTNSTHSSTHCQAKRALD